MNDQRKTGTIELSALEHSIEEIKNERGIFIPFNPNPSVYVGKKKDGRDKVVLDVEFKETPNGHADELIKAKITSEGFRRMNLKDAPSSTWDKYTPILGNTFNQHLPTKEKTKNQQYDDLPPDTMPDDLKGDWK